MMMNLIMRLWKDEEGQGLVEYGLIIAVISLVIIFAGPPIYDAIMDLFEDIADELEAPTAPSGT